MIQFAGKTPNVDIRIEFIGLREGEKLHEELFHDDELLSDTGYEKILLAQSRSVALDTVSLACDALERCVERFDNAGMERLVRQLVPEYRGRGSDDGMVVEEARA
ncbi:MAG: polysaccharide biosynthesis protein [Gammaproteobacteria bacterium]|nr:polysaccharide biosynthesis protein [Gammaproteobacteria bacterium]